MQPLAVYKTARCSLILPTKMLVRTRYNQLTYIMGMVYLIESMIFADMQLCCIVRGASAGGTSDTVAKMRMAMDCWIHWYRWLTRLPNESFECVPHCACTVQLSSRRAQSNFCCLLSMVFLANKQLCPWLQNQNEDLKWNDSPWVFFLASDEAVSVKLIRVWVAPSEVFKTATGSWGCLEVDGAASGCWVGWASNTRH